MNVDYPALFALMGGLVGVITTALSMSRSLDVRFGQLRSQLSEQDQRLSLDLAKLRQEIGVNDTRDLSKLEHLEYQINANRELINHRTQRFCSELERQHADLSADIDDLKRYLEKTTDFERRKNS